MFHVLGDRRNTNCLMKRLLTVIHYHLLLHLSLWKIFTTLRYFFFNGLSQQYSNSYFLQFILSPGKCNSILLMSARSSLCSMHWKDRRKSYGRPQKVHEFNHGYYELVPINFRFLLLTYYSTKGSSTYLSLWVSLFIKNLLFFHLICKKYLDENNQWKQAGIWMFWLKGKVNARLKHKY